MKHTTGSLYIGPQVKYNALSPKADPRTAAFPQRQAELSHANLALPIATIRELVAV